MINFKNCEIHSDKIGNAKSFGSWKIPFYSSMLTCVSYGQCPGDDD